MSDSIPSGVTEDIVDVDRVFRDAGPPTPSEFAQAIQGSTILQIAGDIREMIDRGENVLNLTVGDFRPDQFPIPEGLRDRIVDALRAGETNYPPVAGVPELRKAICQLLRDDFRLEYPLDGILVGGGARPLIYASFMATIDPGETVVYPVPSWNNHHYVRLARAQGVALPVDAAKNFHLDRSDLEPHLRTARLLILNSPLNPTGTCISQEALEGIAAAICEENQRRSGTGDRPLFLVYDQVYNTLTFDDARHFTPVELVPEVAPYTVLIDAVSKGMSGTGLRVGWAAGAPSLLKKMKSLAGHFGAWAPRPEQVATAGFFRDRDALAAHRRHIRSELSSRLNALHEGFTAMRKAGLPVEHIEPQGAIYLSVRFDLAGKTLAGKAIASTEDVRQALLQQAGFAVVPFEAFGFEGEVGWVRLSVGAVSLQEVEQGLGRVRAMLEAAR